MATTFNRYSTMEQDNNNNPSFYENVEKMEKSENTDFNQENYQNEVNTQQANSSDYEQTELQQPPLHPAMLVSPNNQNSTLLYQMNEIQEGTDVSQGHQPQVFLPNNEDIQTQTLAYPPNHFTYQTTENMENPNNFQIPPVLPDQQIYVGPVPDDNIPPPTVIFPPAVLNPGYTLQNLPNFSPNSNLPINPNISPPSYDQTTGIPIPTNVLPGIAAINGNLPPGFMVDPALMNPFQLNIPDPNHNSDYNQTQTGENQILTLKREADSGMSDIDTLKRSRRIGTPDPQQEQIKAQVCQHLKETERFSKTA